jgi:hypothetical protein
MNLRRIIRQIIVETLKTSKGWEDYNASTHKSEDNVSLDTGYKAAYHRQYTDAIHDAELLHDLQKGGSNIVSKKKTKTRKNA